MQAFRTDRDVLLLLAAHLHEEAATRRAVFTLSLAQLPKPWGFLVFAGLERALQQLDALHFGDDDIAYLRSAPGIADVCSDAFEAFLRTYRFSGDLDAYAEGTVLTRPGTLARVEGTLADVTLVESVLLGVIQSETRIASKAARVVLAAKGRGVYELGARSLDPEAAPHAARAAWIGGCEGTSCEAAGVAFGATVTSRRATLRDDLDEYSIAARVALGDARDAFEVGARLVLSPDVPVLGMVYAPAEGDVATLPPVLRFGKRVGAVQHAHDLAREARERCLAGVAALPAELRTIGDGTPTR